MSNGEAIGISAASVRTERVAAQRTVFILASNQLLREGLKLGLKRSQFVVNGEGKDLDEAWKQSGCVVTPDLVAIVGTNSGNIDVALCDIRKARSTFPDARCAIVADQLSSAEVLRALQAGAGAILSMDASFSTILSSLKLVIAGQQIFPMLPVAQLALQGEAPLDVARPVPREVIVSRPEPPPAQSRSNLVPFNQHAGFLRSEPAPLSPIRPALSAGGEGGLGPLTLSDREEQILRCLVTGQPNKVIARELGIAETTVKVHVKSVLRKVRAANRTQAAIWAINHRSALPQPELVPVLTGGIVGKSHAG